METILAVAVLAAVLGVAVVAVPAMRRVAVALVAALLVVAVLAAPAHAKESGWGCGGACRHGGR